jgi:hypothetical protein
MGMGMGGGSYYGYYVDVGVVVQPGLQHRLPMKLSPDLCMICHW